MIREVNEHGYGGGINPSMGRASKTVFKKNCTIFAEPFRWQMLDQTQMATILCCTKSTSPIFGNLVRTGGWPEKLPKSYDRRGTPHLDQRHTVFEPIDMDEASLLCWMSLGCWTGMMLDKPVEDVVVKPSKLRLIWKLEIEVGGPLRAFQPYGTCCRGTRVRCQGGLIHISELEVVM